MSINTALVVESFNAIRPHALEVIDHFYEELWTRYPQSKPLFKGVNMKKQKAALANSLAHLVDFIGEPAHLADYLFKMGGRHFEYGATEEHFGWVAEALLATFEYYLEDNWTEELKASWVEFYTYAAGEMTKGMVSARAKAKTRPVEPVTPPEPTIEEMARQLARDIFKKTLEEEAQAYLQTMVKDKVRDVLKKSLEAEAKEMMASIRGRSKVA